MQLHNLAHFLLPSELFRLLGVVYPAEGPKAAMKVFDRSRMSSKQRRYLFVTVSKALQKILLQRREEGSGSD